MLKKSDELCSFRVSQKNDWFLRVLTQFIARISLHDLDAPVTVSESHHDSSVPAAHERVPALLLNSGHDSNLRFAVVR